MFEDGIYSQTPAHFYQTCSIDVYLNRFDVPFIFVFIDLKSQEPYTDIRLKDKVLLLDLLIYESFNMFILKNYSLNFTEKIY